MHALPRLLLVFAVLALAGCATTPKSVSDRLFFGRAIPGGGEVTEAQWNTFVAEVIVPRFPDGFTIWSARGHWKGDDGVQVAEPATVLEGRRSFGDESPEFVAWFSRAMPGGRDQTPHGSGEPCHVA